MDSTSTATGLVNTDPPVHEKRGGETLRNPPLSVEEMKRKLRNAQQRLAGPGASKAEAQIHDVQDVEASVCSSPKLKKTLSPESYQTVRHRVTRIDTSRIANGVERHLATHRLSKAAYVPAKATKAKRQFSSSGVEWSHMPRTRLDPHLKRDLQLLKMRSTWDPKRHYKTDNQKPILPKFSQVGTIVEGPTEYYSSRISKRNRKRSFVEEVLAVEEGTGRFANKYNDIQASKISGRRGYYNQLKQKRSGKS
ncbi:MAG: hypothetical protein Q9207_008136 [Kuettlingeria erythrocarpa]